MMNDILFSIMAGLAGAAIIFFAKSESMETRIKIILFILLSGAYTWIFMDNIKEAKDIQMYVYSLIMLFLFWASTSAIVFVWSGFSGYHHTYTFPLVFFLVAFLGLIFYGGKLPKYEDLNGQKNTKSDTLENVKLTSNSDFSIHGVIAFVSDEFISDRVGACHFIEFQGYKQKYYVSDVAYPEVIWTKKGDSVVIDCIANDYFVVGFENSKFKESRNGSGVIHQTPVIRKRSRATGLPIPISNN